MNSNFEYSIEDNFVIVIDLNKGMSVTNDVENVARYIENQEKVKIQDYKFIYRDTSGIFDAVEFSSTYSPRFISLNARRLEEAKKQFS